MWTNKFIDLQCSFLRGSDSIIHIEIKLGFESFTPHFAFFISTGITSKRSSRIQIERKVLNRKRECVVCLLPQKAVLVLHHLTGTTLKRQKHVLSWNVTSTSVGQCQTKNNVVPFNMLSRPSAMRNIQTYMNLH